MPIYEYVCRDCGEKFEKLIRTSTDLSPVKCPDCSSEQVQKKVSVCGFLGGGASTGAGDLSSAGSCAPAGGG